MTNKRNQPSNTRPRDKTTLDWNEIRRRNAERLDAEVAAGVDDLMTARRRRDREQLTLAQIDRTHLTAAESDRFFGKVRERQAPTPSVYRSKAKPPSELQVRRPSKDQIDAMVHLYTQENMMPAKIAETLGLTNKTVIKHLRHRQVYDVKKHQSHKIAAAQMAHTTQPNERYL